MSSSEKSKGLCSALVDSLLSCIPPKSPTPGSSGAAVGTIKPENIQIGLSKIFLRKQAHDVLEACRARLHARAAKKIQAAYRGYTVRAFYKDMIWAARLLQRVARGMLARTKVFFLRRDRASLLLQSFVRGSAKRQKYIRFRSAVIALQGCVRTRSAKRVVADKRYLHNALRLQRIFRGLFRKFRFLQFRRSVICLQCALRKRVAVRVLKALRVAAKDLGHLKQSNDALKKEIAELRAKAVEDARRNLLVQQSRQNEETATKLQTELERLRVELVQAKAMVEMERKFRAESESQTTQLSEELRAAKAQLQKRALFAASFSNRDPQAHAQSGIAASQRMPQLDLPLVTLDGNSNGAVASGFLSARVPIKRSMTAMPDNPRSAPDEPMSLIPMPSGRSRASVTPQRPPTSGSKTRVVRSASSAPLPRLAQPCPGAPLSLSATLLDEDVEDSSAGPSTGPSTGSGSGSSFVTSPTPHADEMTSPNPDSEEIATPTPTPEDNGAASSTAQRGAMMPRVGAGVVRRRRPPTVPALSLALASTPTPSR